MPSHTIAQNLQRLQTARTNIASAITTKGGTVASGAGFEDFSTAIGTIPSGGSATLITKNISANGTYNAASDSADGYSSVTVAVPNTYSAGDEGKVVSNGALVAQTAYPSTVTTNGTITTTTNNSVTIDVPNTYTASDEGKVVSSGALVAQTARPDTITTNGSYITTNYNSVTVNVPTGGGGSSLDTTKMTTFPQLYQSSEPRWEVSSITKLNISEALWTDGTYVYRSSGSTQRVLNAGYTWATKTWTGMDDITQFYGTYTWTDGTNIYFSNGNGYQYVLDKATSTWSEKTWGTNIPTYGTQVWSDGTDIYYSGASVHYVLNKTTGVWDNKTWNGLSVFTGSYIWTDGTDIYYSAGANQYVLDKATSTWSAKTWTGLTNFEGQNVWTLNGTIYHSNGTGNHHQLDKATSTWSAKTWSVDNFKGYDVCRLYNQTFIINTSLAYVLIEPNSYVYK